MSHHDDPDNHWHQSAEDAAKEAARSAAFKVGLVPLVLLWASVVLAVAALLTTFTSAALSLYDLRGWPQWTAGAYLVGLSLLAMRALGPTLRALRTEPPDCGDPTLKQSLDWLNDRNSWVLRLVTWPLALLATVHLTAVSVPTVLAAVVANLGWLALDILTLATVPLRRTLVRLGRFR